MSTADQQLAIGIDVGGTTIKGVLADTRGNIIATSRPSLLRAPVPKTSLPQPRDWPTLCARIRPRRRLAHASLGLLTKNTGSVFFLPT